MSILRTFYVYVEKIRKKIRKLKRAINTINKGNQRALLDGCSQDLRKKYVNPFILRIKK